MAKTGWVWDGTQFVALTAPVGAFPNSVTWYQSASPTNQITGQTWFNTNNKIFYVYSGSAWIPVNSVVDYTANSPANPLIGEIWIDSDHNEVHVFDGSSWKAEEKTLTVALSDETTAITTGTAKLTMRAPYAMTLTKIPRASLSAASTSGLPTVDINVNGTSVLGANKLSIDANEKTSTTAATPTTIATSSIADDAEITFDIDVAGTGAKGLKVTLYFERT